MNLAAPRRQLAIGVFIGFLLSAVSANALNFDVARWRWKAPTSLELTSTNRGDPMRITWSIVPDGALIHDYFDDYNTLNSAFLANAVGPGYTNIIRNVFARLGSVCGLQFQETADNGLNVGWAPGVLGQRGDVYVCASDLFTVGFSGAAWADMPRPGSSSVLRLNTGLNSWTPYLFQQVVMHEAGHTIGLAHQYIYENTTATTEFRTSDNQFGSIVGFLNGNGPQFDDLYALHRLYGDRWERDGGNDTLATATDLGLVANGTARSLGTEINGLEVAATQTDFLSIDGGSDTDCFHFTLAQPGQVTITVTPKGPTYDYAPEGGSRVTFEASKQNALQFEVLSGAGQSLASVPSGELGTIRTFTQILGIGDYVVRVQGTQDTCQFYRLDVAAVPAVQPPTPSANINLSQQVVQIGFETVAGFRYRVLYTDTYPAANWTELAPGWTNAVSSRISVPDQLSPSRPQRFYRVEAGTIP